MSVNANRMGIEVAGAVALVCCAMLLGLSVALSLGIAFLYYGTQNRDATCGEEIARYAIVQGALDVTTAPLLLCGACARLATLRRRTRHRPPPPPVPHAAVLLMVVSSLRESMGALVGTVLNLCVICGLGMARLGVLIWGTVIVFR
jgi:hypothetical protein